jgi:uncharacterized Zn finger protein (UPF0148 family)
MNKILNWENLKKRACPKCGFPLKEGKLFYCSCGFLISKGKLYDRSSEESLESQANLLIKNYNTLKSKKPQVSL